MIKNLDKFCNMINDVDSQLYEIAKILKGIPGVTTPMYANPRHIKPSML